MSYRELAHSLIDQIPESKMHYIVTYLQGAAVPEEIPNSETLEAFAETDEMIRTTAFQGQRRRILFNARCGGMTC